MSLLVLRIVSGPGIGRTVDLPPSGVLRIGRTAPGMGVQELDRLEKG